MNSLKRCPSEGAFRRRLDDSTLVIAHHLQHLEGEIRQDCEDLVKERTNGRYTVEDSHGDEVGDHIGVVQGHRGVEVVSVQSFEQGSRDFLWWRRRGAGHGSTFRATCQSNRCSPSPYCAPTSSVTMSVGVRALVLLTHLPVRPQ